MRNKELKKYQRQSQLLIKLLQHKNSLITHKLINPRLPKQQSQKNMGKQQPSIVEQLIDFAFKFDSNPFEDFYVLLVVRFFIYIYLFIKLSDILLGYQRPNLKTRVLRKFQFVYGDHILKDLNKDDMQQLEVTINNTILNATKELKAKSVPHKLNAEKLNMIESERRSLKLQEATESTGSTLTRKSLMLKFDLQRNQYYEPQSPLVSNKSQIQNEEKPKQTEVQQIQDFTQEVQGQSEEEQLSPTFPRAKMVKIPKAFQEQIIEQQDFVDNQIKIDSIHEPNIHYPEEELSGMNLEIQEKFIKDEENLLHLSHEELHDSYTGKQGSQNQNKEFQIFPSIIKTESTGITENYTNELET